MPTAFAGIAIAAEGRDSRSCAYLLRLAEKAFLLRLTSALGGLDLDYGLPAKLPSIGAKSPAPGGASRTLLCKVLPANGPVEARRRSAP